MRPRGSRTFALAAAATVALLEGCFGSPRTKTDSETHFACMVDAECRRFGKDSRCHEGFCRTRLPSSPEDRPDAGEPLGISSGGARSGAGGNTGSNAGGRDAATAEPPVDDAGQTTTTGGRTGIKDESTGSAGGPSAGSGAPLDVPWDQPLASPVTFHGVVKLAPGFAVPSGSLRVSLVWRAPPGFAPVCETGGGMRQSPTVQSGDGTLTTPGRFSLTVDRSPPKAAFVGAVAAEGAVVVFVDGNGNGVLDLATPDVISRDVIVGTSTPYDTLQSLGSWPDSVNYRITYSTKVLNGAPPIPEGYGAYRIHTNASEDPGESERWSITSDLSIVLGDSRRLQMLTCSFICFTSDTSFVCPDGYAALPPGDRAECGPVGSESQDYTWFRESCDACTCRGASCRYSRDTTMEPAPGWPCPVGDPGLR